MKVIHRRGTLDPAGHSLVMAVVLVAQLAPVVAVAMGEVEQEGIRVMAVLVALGLMAVVVEAAV